MTKRLSIVDYLAKADVDFLACVDERRIIYDSENFLYHNNSIPIKLPGGIYCVIDTLKTILDVSENEAWDIVFKAHIPICAHQEPEHCSQNTNKTIGPLGCGYAYLIENSPDKVDAVETVLAKNRLMKVKELGGKIYTVQGQHHINYVTMVWMEGMSIDTERSLTESNVGILNCDPWIGGLYVSKINRANPNIHLDKDVFIEQIVRQFKLVAQVIAPDIPIEEIFSN
jgi:hypothetical protein